jgi:hypothetical protein
MDPIPPECQSIADELQALMEERADLQAQLQSAATSQKPGLVAQIKKLNTQIAEKEAELDQCMGVEPPRPPLTCTLPGTAVIRTGDSRAPGPFVVSVTLILTFSGPNREIVTLNFPGISLPLALSGPLGISCTDTITISLLGGQAVGTYSPSFPNNIDIPATFAVSHSLSGGFFCSLIPAGPSTLALTPPGLTTRTVFSSLSATGTLFGSALNKTTGSVTLVGAGVLTGGALGGAACDVTVSGTLACGSQPLP